MKKFYEVFKEDHPQHMRHYKKLLTTESPIKWDGVNFPASNDDIDTFETINQILYQLMFMLKMRTEPSEQTE